ncbi:MAG: LacI family DNA-binding transcriptional regulator [Lachnospiraceae bacterium]|nr:LacI family DNA-binding transcriptional regulator [Lachnospiraceae bacterium]
MENDRIRISDIAEELGLSTAAVSYVIHGKTGKVSEETVKRVQELLEKRGYIPSMAGILLAQNNSRIIGIVVNDHEKYEGRVLEDGFISSAINELSKQIDEAGYFMMIKTMTQWDEIARFASMWNMDGLVLMGFCEQDYRKLRDSIRIPFVVYDGYFQETRGICNLTLDNHGGGYQVGAYLKRMGHEKVLCVSDNFICTDSERMDGCTEAMGAGSVSFLQIPFQKEARMRFYGERIEEVLKYTAVFAVSDYYAVELMHFLQERGIKIPEDISIVGFDDSPICTYCVPELTTVRQDVSLRAKHAVTMLQKLKNNTAEPSAMRLPVFLVERQSVKKRNEET